MALPVSRTAFSNTERKELCEWAQGEEEKTGCRPKWQAVQKWFADTHNRKVISQSTISKTLKRSTEFLGQELVHPHQKKRREADFPKLDEALFIWQKCIEKSVPVSGLVLKEKAISFFPILYPGMIYYRVLLHERGLTSCVTIIGINPPKFLDGWLAASKHRHGIKEYKSHGESGSVDVQQGELEMEKIQKILANYDLDDIYNMDETGYYFALQPDRGLSTEQLEGKKKDKRRITVALTCNGTGRDRLPPWIIGTAKNPRCFKNINRATLGCHYRSNHTAWMKFGIMIEFLLWFDRKMRGRKVALCLDNFSAHEKGVREVGGDLGLQNTHIIWLPANTTSKFQPMDQGIIRTWKAYTRRHFIRYLIEKIDKLEPNQKLPVPNILQAIHWAVEAWNFDLKMSTIYNCFMKSGIKTMEPTSSKFRYHGIVQYNIVILIILDQNSVEAVPGPPASELDEIRVELLNSIEILSHGNHIANSIDIEEFLNPGNEIVEDSSNTLEVSIFYVSEVLYRILILL